MPKTYRYIVLFVMLFAMAAGAIQGKLEKERLSGEIRGKLSVLSAGIQEAIGDSLAAGQSRRIERTVSQMKKRDAGLISIFVCADGNKVFESGGEDSSWTAICADPFVLRNEANHASESRIQKAGGKDELLYVRGLESQALQENKASLVIVHSLSGVDAAARMAFTRAALIALIAGLIAFGLFEVLMRHVLRRSMLFLAHWIQNAFMGHHAGGASSKLHEINEKLPKEFRELTKELGSLALKMRQDRLRLVAGGAASQGGLLRDQWELLRTRVRDVLKGRQLIIIANREPYSHELREGRIETVRPASGVVSALEPIMRLCGGGIWIAHGSGSADRQVVDANDEQKVPPENPTYTLRRVWLTKEEENGYYYGFANEGLWPLCHLAYTRPIFRLSDWEMYQRVNQKFADATLRGQGAANAVILVQDYHYALLPRLLRERAPEANIEIFWHIPWPNPEAFGICPQYKELLKGMLGADVVGFHTQFHCNNFLETCDRYLECRVDWERFSVTIGNRETLVRSYPISIAAEPVKRLSEGDRALLRDKYGITAPYVAVGVDRLDYTKGLLERIAGVERFLEKYPQYVGRFQFVEMGTPSRTNIHIYRALTLEIEAAIARVNERFGANGYNPIVMLKGQFDWKEVAAFYQLGQACLVTSLHDGMNLVAKEYVWSQEADQGALILSRFTGAARELSEALIVNPYSSEEIADALYQSLIMTKEQRLARMQSMKEKVESHNAFHWATDLLAGVNAKT